MLYTSTFYRFCKFVNQKQLKDQLASILGPLL